MIFGTQLNIEFIIYDEIISIKYIFCLPSFQLVLVNVVFTSFHSDSYAL